MHPTTDPQIASLLATTMCAGAAMVWLGVRGGLLDRRVRRLCPSCGVPLGARRRCNCSG